MASKVMEILFQIKGQMDGRVENSFYSLNKKTVELSKSIRNLQTNMHNMKYSGVSATDNANLAKAIGMNREMNKLIRERAKLELQTQKAAAYTNAKQNLMSQIGEAVALGGTIITVTSPLRNAISGAMDFEKQMSRVSAISGADSDSLAKLTQKAEEMGAKLPFTTLEAGKAFEYMAMAGWKTEQMMAGIEPVMKLALASGEDLAMVSDIVTDAMSAFGMKAEDAAHFSDVLARAATNSNTTVGLMGNTFQYVAPVAGALKYSVEDTALAIDMMANMGIKGEKAGTALRSTFSRVEEITNQLGIEVTNADGSMRPFRDVLIDTREAFKGMTDAEKKAYAESIAGREAMSGFLALMDTSDEDMMKYIDAIDNAAGATEEMSEKMMNNTAGAWTKFTSALDVAGKKIGNIFLPAVRAVFEYMANGAGKVAEFVANNQDLIESVSIAATVLMGLLSVWKLVNVVMGIWSLVMAASPITWVIIGISILVAAGWYLYKNWDKIVALISNEWEYLKNTTASIIDGIVQYFTDCWNRLVGWLQPFFDAISDAAAAIWESPTAKIALFVAGPIGWIITAASGIITNWEAVKSFFENMWDGAIKALDNFVSYVSDKLGSISNFLNTPIFGSADVSVAHNAAGGIYGRGAFLTTFAEDSGESAIPHTPTARNIGLLAKTNEIMGSPLGGNSYSIPINITVNGSADAGTAQDIGTQVEAAVRRALDNIANQKARVSYA